jgi:hypothetical protein
VGKFATRGKTFFQGQKICVKKKGGTRKLREKEGPKKLCEKSRIEKAGQKMQKRRAKKVSRVCWGTRNF